MQDQDRIDYFLERERSERAAAKRATTAAARGAHQDLAQGYADLARPRIAGTLHITARRG